VDQSVCLHAECRTPLPIDAPFTLK